MDDHKRVVYDLYGEKGLESYGLEVWAIDVNNWRINNQFVVPEMYQKWRLAIPLSFEV